MICSGLVCSAWGAGCLQLSQMLKPVFDKVSASLARKTCHRVHISLTMKAHQSALLVDKGL